MRSRYPELTASQVAHRLRVTADPPPAERPDPALGWGVVNPYAAVTAVVPSELEEQPSPARQPTISHPVIPEDDPIPRIVATLTVASAAVLAFVGVLAGVFGPPGWRRRWRRSRVAVVAGADEAGANSSVEPPGGPDGGPSDPDGGDQPDGAVREGNPRAVTPAGGAVGRRGRPPPPRCPERGPRADVPVPVSTPALGGPDRGRVAEGVARRPRSCRGRGRATRPRGGRRPPPGSPALERRGRRDEATGHRLTAPPCWTWGVPSALWSGGGASP
ncbi:hypothetical protein [Actinoalloteichus caeruleus]|uniref:Uncharacterized protein n=1 Tax=Actinoalloteichus caeruleus DSM 43889 TaxID=1120930 RepID=A0ABT1JDX4_ACTCY|nr:hypothetical protein [Actinoalloteichus caeruleus]MCP2330705.1 hypothetical protein [Actinoalloteichus caeruleus DSM 43889]